MEPTAKSPQMEDFITKTFGVDRVDCIRRNICVPAPIGCGKPCEGFRDELSAREYQISGLCQECQDLVWNG